MPSDKLLDLIHAVGSHVCAASRCFSLTEVKWCQKKSSWLALQNIILASDFYEAMIMLDMTSLQNVIVVFQLVVACSLSFDQKSPFSDRLDILLQLIDTDDSAVSKAMSNTKLVRILIAVASLRSKTNKSKSFWVYHNMTRVLAHVLKRHPSLMKMNVLRSKSKNGSGRTCRFTQEDIKAYL